MTIDVLVLAWDAVDGGGVGLRAAGLASALARHGADVRVVTRLAEDEQPPTVRGVEVHAVPDVAPLLPGDLDSRVLRARGFASPALAVVTRRLVERAVDATLVVGPDPLAVATRLPASAGTVVLDPGVRGSPDWEAIGGAAGLLRATGRPVALAAPTPALAVAGHAAVGEQPVVVPAAGPTPRTRPGPPPPTGPVHLVAGPGATHDRAARRLRAAMDVGRVRRVVTGTTRFRPAVSVVLDPEAGDAVLLGAARGVPVVAPTGSAGDLAGLLGGVVVEDEAEAVARCVELLADDELAASLGDAALAASEQARREAIGVIVRLLSASAPGHRRDPGSLLRPVD